MGYLNDDSIVILLLCSDLVLDRSLKDNPKPLTTLQWQNLSERIKYSLERPADLLNEYNSNIKSILGISDKEANRLNYLMSRKVGLAIEIENLRSKGIFITTRAEKNYPARLKRILKKKCPPVLYFAGDINMSKLNAIAIVGSRSIDKAGIKFTEKLSAKCVSSDLIVVSGGAKGVDSISETTAIKQGGKAISIVSDSLAKKIMINANRKAIISGSLLMVSAVNPNATFRGFNAMDRNKYIYAMSDFSVAVASDFNKGGTWNGAIENIKNSWVPLLVRSEEGIPMGNHELLKKGGLKLTNNELNDEFDFKKWLIGKKNELNKDSETQITMYDTIDTVLKVEVKDLYDLIVNEIVDYFDKPRVIKNAARVFNVLEDQLILWINKAIEDGLLIKENNTEKYFKIDRRN